MAEKFLEKDFAHWTAEPGMPTT